MVAFRPIFAAVRTFFRASSTTYQSVAYRLKSPPLPNGPVMSNARKIALVGLGYRGYRTHFLGLLGNPSISIIAVCDTNHAALESFSAKHPGIPTYQSLSQLLQSHTPDFAVLSVPHGAHVECVTTLAASSIPILKEKPVAESMIEYDWMRSLSVKVGVTFQKRFEPHFLHFKSLLALVGDAAAVEANLGLNIGNLEETWRAGSGVGATEDLGCHILDLIVWLFGPPTSVVAYRVPSVRRLQRYGGDDVSDIMMEWGPKNCIGHVRLSRVAHKNSQSITVTGTNGTLSLDGHVIMHHDARGRETLHIKHQPIERQVIQSMAQEFGDWVAGRGPEFATSLANVLHTVSVIDAIKSSFASRRVESSFSHLSTQVSGAPKNRYLSRAFSSRAATATFCTLSFPSNRDKIYHLNTEASIPAVGLGTRRAERPGQIYDAVRTALEIGYRHIDTAQSSGNEHEIGQAVKDSGVSRNQIWITTKLDNRWHTRVEEALELSLTALGMDYLDLYLMHWPVSTSSKGFAIELNNWNFINTWEEMQKIPSHKVHNIGVSNFGIANLQRLLHHPSCKVVPAVNQIELHPYWPSWRILSYCKNHGIHCTAYSCLGSTGSPLFDNPVVLELSRCKGKSPQQILIMWGIQRGTSVVPKTVSPVRIKENSELDGWGLSNHEMDLLNGCTTRFKSCNGKWLRGKIFFEDGD